jgi:hypothetical protein
MIKFNKTSMAQSSTDQMLPEPVPKKLIKEIRETWGDDNKNNVGRKKPENDDAFYREMAKHAFARECFYFDSKFVPMEMNMLTPEEVEEARWKKAR